MADTYGPPIDAADAAVQMREQDERIRAWLDRGKAPSPQPGAHPTPPGVELPKPGEEEAAFYDAINHGVPPEADRPTGAAPTAITLPEVQIGPQQPAAPRGYGSSVPGKSTEPFGGFYYPEGYDADAAAAWIDGDITEEEYDRRNQAYADYQSSLPGLMADRARMPGRAAAEQADIRRQQMGLAERFADQNAEQVGQRRQALDAAQAQAEGQRARIQQGIARRLQEYETATAEVSKERIDPDRWMSGGNGIAARIAMALDNAGAALTGSAPTVVKLIQQRIDNDIQAQRDNLMNKRQGARDKLSTLGELRNRLGDIDMAEAAYRKATYERYADYAAQQKAKNLKPWQALEAEKMEAALRSEAQQVEADLQIAAKRAEIMQEQERQRMAMAEAAARAEAQRRANDPLGGLPWRDARNEEVERYLPGLGGYARSKSDYDALAPKAALIKEQQDILGEFAAMDAQSGGKLSPTMRARGVWLSNRLAYLDSLALEQGVVREHEMEANRKVTPTGAEFSLVDVRTMVNTRKQVLDNAIARASEGRVVPAVVDMRGKKPQIAIIPETQERREQQAGRAMKRAGY